jgi:hypothetical protein
MPRADMTEPVENVQAGQDAVGGDQVVEDRIEDCHRSSLHESGSVPPRLDRDPVAQWND